MKKRIIGIDIGGVIIDRKNGGASPSFNEGDHRYSPEIPGALRGIRRLRQNGDEIFLISKVGDDFRKKTNDWFAFCDFHHFTGVSKDHLLYCYERSFKSTLCLKLKISHLIDDRLVVHHALSNYPIEGYLFNPNPEDARRCRDTLPRVHHVSSWNELLDQHLLVQSFASVQA